MSSTGPVTEACDLRSAPMTISIDSAIHSGTGSRSTSSSPLPTGMGHSLLRYAPRLPFSQMHVPDLSHESHVHWEPLLKSTPRMSDSQPHPQDLVSRSWMLQPANNTWPRVHKSTCRQIETNIGAMVVEEKVFNDSSPSYDSALELSMSDRLVESFSEVMSPR